VVRVAATAATTHRRRGGAGGLHDGGLRGDVLFPLLVTSCLDDVISDDAAVAWTMGVSVGPLVTSYPNCLRRHARSCLRCPLLMTSCLDDIISDDAAVAVTASATVGEEAPDGNRTAASEGDLVDGSPRPPHQRRPSGMRATLSCSQLLGSTDRRHPPLIAVNSNPALMSRTAGTADDHQRDGPAPVSST